MNNNFQIRKVAVLGAGVMGAQIAAHLVNANVPTILFDLPAQKNDSNRQGDPDGIVNKALDGLKKLEPSPLASPAKINFIAAANYDQHLEQLRDCDLVIEAIAERMDWKSDLYHKVAPYLGAQTIFASNTSGLSINKLAEAFPENLRHRFCGGQFLRPIAFTQNIFYRIIGFAIGQTISLRRQIQHMNVLAGFLIHAAFAFLPQRALFD